MNLIGLAGKIHTGKSFLADYLFSMIGSCIILNFGDILKKEVAKEFGFPVTHCYSMEGKNTEIMIEALLLRKYEVPKTIMTVRELLQWYGTDYIRAKNPNHWVNEMSKKLQIEKDLKYTTVIIADVRFPNEVDFITGRGGKVIRLLPYPSWCYPSDHESETALDEYEERRCFWLQIAPPFGKLEPTAAYIKELLEYV